MAASIFHLGIFADHKDRRDADGDQNDVRSEYSGSLHFFFHVDFSLILFDRFLICFADIVYADDLYFFLQSLAEFFQVSGRNDAFI